MIKFCRICDVLLWSIICSRGQALTATRFGEQYSRTTSRLHDGSTNKLWNSAGKCIESSSFLLTTTIFFRLEARFRRSYEDDEEEHDDFSRQRSYATDRPTQTALDVMRPAIVPAKPKIVVLGATGKIGRMVVKQLLDLKSIDMTIVALVRDYDKAVRVLYDDMAATRSSKGPKLQIVQGNLVPPEELPGFVEDAEEEQVWLEKAESAAKFYGTKTQDYDNREELPDINESLEYAIKDSTTVISCVGSIRPTNLWTDILERPFIRLLNPDVSKWCNDARHPYYVHYASTRKALGYVEREQLRREAAAEVLAEDLAVDRIRVPRIRFIRISDLCVGQKPWDFVPLITNAIHSVVFRYQEMAEQLLGQSTLVETVILRPGDLVDDERDVNSTSIQVCASGKVPHPARIGREDVASLAVASALFATRNTTNSETDEPFHYTLACRWVGDGMDPYPSQGKKSDGHTDAQMALHNTLKKIYRKEKRSRQRKAELKAKRKKLGEHYDDEDTPEILLRLANKLQQQRQRPNPHGVCVATLIYFFLGIVLKAVIFPILEVVPGGKTWILPLLNRLNEKVVMVTAFLVGRLMILAPWINHRPKQHIFL